MKKLFSYLSLVLIYQSQAFADTMTIDAHCIYQPPGKSFVAFAIKGLWEKTGIVEVGNSNPRKLIAKNGLGSWTTFKSEFVLDGESNKIEFVNYYSPSIGTLRVNNGKPISIACEILGKNL